MSVLKGNKSFYDYEVSDLLAWNLKAWLDYGLIEMGAYTNAIFSSTATSGLTDLKRAKDDRYADGQIYEAFGPHFIWETDVQPIGRSDKPVIASGVYIDNVFYPPPGSGNYTYTMDFRHGRVIFGSGLASGTSVKCEHSFGDIASYLVDDAEWKTITHEFTKGYDELESLSPSGMAQKLKKNRVWLPCVVIDVGDRTNEPLQLGGGEIHVFDVDYHIFSDKSFANRRLCDVLGNQYQTTISLFNINDFNFPYNYNGSVASGAMTYPVVSSDNSPYFWDRARVMTTDGGPMNPETDVYRGTCSHTIEIERHLITY